MTLRYTCAILLLLMSFVSLSPAQQAPEYVKTAPKEYQEPPQPKCDAYNMQNLVALSIREKTCYYRDQLISPSAISGAALFAGIAQAMDSPPEWPQGAKGFGWRFGTRYVQGMAKSTGTYLAGLALHEDPRTLRPDCPTDGRDTHGLLRTQAAPKSVGQRLFNAVKVNFWAKDDNCKAHPAFAATVGALSSGFVGMAWTPDSSNTITKAFVRSGTALGGMIGNRVFAEFQGDITRLVTGSGRKPKGGS